MWCQPPRANEFIAREARSSARRGFQPLDTGQIWKEMRGFPCNPTQDLLPTSLSIAPFSPLIRCRLPLRQLFAPFIPLSEKSFAKVQGLKPEGIRPGKAEAHEVEAGGGVCVTFRSP
jgi:hypothetical protein